MASDDGTGTGDTRAVRRHRLLRWFERYAITFTLVEWQPLRHTREELMDRDEDAYEKSYGADGS